MSDSCNKDDPRFFKKPTFVLISQLSFSYPLAILSRSAIFHFDISQLDLRLLAKPYLAKQTSEHYFISAIYLRIYLSIFRCLSMLSASQAVLCRVIGLLEDNELVRMWKEAVVI